MDSEITIPVTMDQVLSEFDGGCLGCGKLVKGTVEPDAERYVCPHCGAPQVFGMLLLIEMNRLTFLPQEPRTIEAEEAGGGMEAMYGTL